MDGTDCAAADAEGLGLAVAVGAGDAEGSTMAVVQPVDVASTDEQRDRQGQAPAVGHAVTRSAGVDVRHGSVYLHRRSRRFRGGLRPGQAER